MKNSQNRERPAYFTPNISNFKLQFLGNNQEFWSTYFVNNFDFSIDPNYSDTVYYNENEKTFLLDSSLVEVSLR